MKSNTTSKNTKKNKESGPSTSGVLLAACCMFIVGCILGFIFLASFPVKALASMDELKALNTAREDRPLGPKDGYYFETPQGQSRNWQAQRDKLLNGTVSEIDISFSDLNAWLGNSFRPGSPPVGPDKPKIVFSPREPKLGTDGSGTVYISLPVSASVWGVAKRYLVSAKGHFNANGHFDLEQMKVNNAIVPQIPGLASSVFNALLGSFSGTEEYESLSQAWSKVKSVEVTENSLLIKL